MMTNEQMRLFQDAIDLRNKKIKEYQTSIEKLQQCNIRDRREIDKYWDEKFKKKK